MKNRHTDTFEPTGVLIVNKHAGVTSHDVVGKIRRLYNTRRVGHTGTLDPMATGVLVVLVGRAAKASEYLASDRKVYRATLRLGITTDTEDTTGTTLTTTEVLPSSDEVEAIRPQFTGKLMQTPPMYSALKVNGKKLVDLAREGITVEREARPIEIHSLEIHPTDLPSDYILTADCSGGTYIRTLCADIGAALGCGGAMASLDRLEACGFSLSEAHSIADLEEMCQEERLNCLIPVESLFRTFPAVTFPSFYERLFRSGCAIALHKLKTNLPLGTRVRALSADGSFFALGEVVTENDSLALKSVKTFVL